MTDPVIKGETVQEYAEDAGKYFGKLEGPKQLHSETATRGRHLARHLPGKEQEYRTAERVAAGFTKTSRSGAFAKAGTGHAFFPSGLKFASDFIDEHTPKGFKPQPKPYEEPIKPEGRMPDMPKLACVMTEKCMDCMEPIDYTAKTFKMNGKYHKGIDAVINVGVIMETNSHKLHAMGLKFGDFFSSMFHATCMERVKEFKKENTPLVQGGAILSDKDRDLLIRYKRELHIHDGRELTIGQYKHVQRLERTARNTQEEIIRQRAAGNDIIFREDRKELSS